MVEQPKKAKRTGVLAKNVMEQSALAKHRGVQTGTHLIRWPRPGSMPTWGVQGSSRVQQGDYPRMWGSPIYRIPGWLLQWLLRPKQLPPLSLQQRSAAESRLVAATA